MKELNQIIVAGLLMLLTRLPAYGQPGQHSVETSKQPSELHFVLSTKDGHTQFHLGEVIEMEEAYSADSPDKYLLLSLPAKLQGGHWAQVRMRPERHVIDRTRDAGGRSAYSILHVNCFVGVGGGFGGGCADCDGAYPLKAAPIHFPYVLTGQFQIMEAGHYFIQAEAASVVRAPLRPGKKRAHCADFEYGGD